MRRLLLLLAASGFLLNAQTYTQSRALLLVLADPAGACSSTAVPSPRLNTVNGKIWACINGAWTVTSGGGGGGGSALSPPGSSNVIVKATTGTNTTSATATDVVATVTPLLNVPNGLLQLDNSAKIPSGQFPALVGDVSSTGLALSVLTVGGQSGANVGATVASFLAPNGSNSLVKTDSGSHIPNALLNALLPVPAGTNYVPWVASSNTVQAATATNLKGVLGFPPDSVGFLMNDGTGHYSYATPSGGGGVNTPFGANTVYAGPASGSAAVPVARSLVSADIPAVNLAVTGNGGATGQLPYASLSGAPALQYQGFLANGVVVVARPNWNLASADANITVTPSDDGLSRTTFTLACPGCTGGGGGTGLQPTGGTNYVPFVTSGTTTAAASSANLLTIIGAPYNALSGSGTSLATVSGSTPTGHLAQFSGNALVDGGTIGSNTQVLYNNAGAIAGDSGHTYNNSTHQEATTGGFASNASGTGTVSIGATFNNVILTATDDSAAFTWKLNAGAPGIALGAAAGGSPGSVTQTGNNFAFDFQFTSGSAPPAGTIATVTFSSDFANTPHCIPFAKGVAVTGLDITPAAHTATITDTGGISAATLYKFTVLCHQ